MESAIKFSTNINVQIKVWFRAIANRRLFFFIVGPIIKPPISDESCLQFKKLFEFRVTSLINYINTTISVLSQSNIAYVEWNVFFNLKCYNYNLEISGNTINNSPCSCSYLPTAHVLTLFNQALQILRVCNIYLRKYTRFYLLG